MQIAGLVDLPVADGRISLSRRNRVDDDVKIVVPFWIETKGRSIEEIDAALAKPASLLERAPAA